MRPTHHPDESWLAAYAAGTLDALRECFVATHLVYCPLCRRMVEHHESAAALLLLPEQPTTIEGEGLVLERLLARLDAAPAGHPGPATGPLTTPLTVQLSGQAVPVPQTLRPLLPADIRWESMAPGWKCATIDNTLDPDMPLRLLEVQAHGVIPRHRHQHVEFVLVLDGILDDHHRNRRYQRGDMFTAAREDEHALSVPAQQHCLCLYALRGRLEFF